MFVLRFSVAVAIQQCTVMADVLSFLLPNRHEHESCDICHFRSLIQKNRRAQAMWSDQLTRKAGWEMNARFIVFLLTTGAIAQLVRRIECVEDSSEMMTCVNTTACFSKQTAKLYYYFLNAGFMADDNEWNISTNNKHSWIKQKSNVK